MNLDVCIKDKYGKLHHKNIRIGYIAFIKHLALAGQGYLPRIDKFKKTLGSFLLFEDYLNFASFQNSSFSLPPPRRYDPTEIGQFSNRAGKAFADYLAKKINGAKVTFGYEAKMKLEGLKIDRKRPDLICDKDTSFFTVEAKGYKKGNVSDKEMTDHKAQSQSGPIKGRFSIACVSYNLYENVKVKYYDPPENGSANDEDLIKGLAKQYFSNVVSYINGEIFDIEDVQINDINFFKLVVSERDSVLFRLYKCLLAHFDCQEFAILLDRNIKDIAQTGNISLLTERYQKRNIYIDSDGIGLQIKRKSNPQRLISEGQMEGIRKIRNCT